MKKTLFLYQINNIYQQKGQDEEKITEKYSKRLSTLTPGFSGADIANLCNEAAILAARGEKQKVEAIDFEMAAERVMGGVELKKEISEEERKIIAYHESGHAVISWFLEGGYPLLKLTVIPRSKGALGYAQYLPSESNLQTKQDLMDMICFILGGRLCEEYFFKSVRKLDLKQQVTTGAYDDLSKSYELAHRMVTKLGMSEKLENVAFFERDYDKTYSDETNKHQRIDDEIQAIIKDCTERTRKLIIQYEVHIKELATQLLEKKTLDLTQIRKILGERPFQPRSTFKAYLEEDIDSFNEELKQLRKETVAVPSETNKAPNESEEKAEIKENSGSTSENIVQ